MSATDERFKVMISDVVIVSLPAGANVVAPPFGPADAGKVLTVSADGSTMEWQTPTR